MREKDLVNKRIKSMGEEEEMDAMRPSCSRARSASCTARCSSAGEEGDQADELRRRKEAFKAEGTGTGRRRRRREPHKNDAEKPRGEEETREEEVNGSAGEKCREEVS